MNVPSLFGFFRIALVCVSIAATTVPSLAQSTVLSITGVVVDTSSGLPLSNASVTASGPATASVTSNRDGRFSFASLAPGIYTLTVRADGYQTALSDSVTVISGLSATVTLNIQRGSVGGTTLRTIGTTSVKASGSLAKSSVLYQQVSSEAMTEQGLYRLGDALRQLPGIVNSGSDTAAAADDLSLNFRGIGNLETLTLIDGHPVAYGLPGQYNFDISPAPLFRDVLAVYGSGADQFYPVNAIGGVFDFQTINPTLKPESSLQQQYGTFDQLSTTLTTTGTIDGIGYAFVAGSQGIDGPIKHDHGIYSYGASQDPGSLDPTIQQTSFYNVDESTNTRTFMGKITVPIGKKTELLLSGLTEKFYDNKTGNGDLDFQTRDQALLEANQNVGTSDAPATYSLYSNNPNFVFGNPATPQYIPGMGAPVAVAAYTVNCPNGTVALSNSLGTPSGTYNPNVIGGPAAVTDPSGNALGTLAKSACVTPQQYANVKSGLNGAGSDAYQTYNLQDYHAKLTQKNGNQESYIDGYVDNYRHHYARDFQTPFFDVPGDNPNSNYENIVNSGLTIGSNWTDAYNSTGIGLYYNNSVYSNVASPGPQAITASVASDFSAFIRESYKFPTLPLTLYANVWNKSAGETNTSFFDPRIAAVVTLKNDVFRLSAGESSTQPDLSAINSPFQPGGLAGITGGLSNSQCQAAPTNPIQIGSAGSSTALKPERGIDTEVSYAHRFFRDSQIQATFYNTNVFGYIQNLDAPLGIFGTGGIDPGYLSAISNAVKSVCGQNFDTNTGLGVGAYVNIGHVRAQGIEVSGRQRIIPKVALDYDYGADTVTLVSAPDVFLASNSNYIVGSQFPSVPLHQYNLGLNYEFVRDANFRIGYHHVSDNNTKNLPAYGYADALITGKVGPGRLALGINNLFNSQAFYQGFQGDGVPVATNSFAGGTPTTTERFGLPFRTATFTYTLSTK